jgi:type I restriction enzyme S subunit
MKKAEWETVALGDLVEPAKMWNPTRSPLDEVFNYIDLSAVDQNSKLITGARQVSCGEAPSRARQLVVRGDVLVSTVRPNLNGVARVPDQLDGATASTGFCVLRASESKLDGSYLFHWVKSPAFVADMVNQATGASYPAVSDRIIFDSRIPLPPLTEQRRIAEVLDRAEALRAKRRAALAQLDSLTQSLFLDLFGESVSNSKDWSKATLGEVADMVTGYPFRSEEYDTSGDSVRLCRGANILPGRVDWNDLARWPKSKATGLDEFSLEAGDVVVAMDRPWISEGFKIARVQPEDCPALLVQRVARLRGRNKTLNEFLFYLLNQPAFTRHCRPTETTIPHISPKDIRSFAFPLPPLVLQREFARRVAAVEKLKAAQRAALADLDALFASLQHRAFRGEL